MFSFLYLFYYCFLFWILCFVSNSFKQKVNLPPFFFYKRKGKNIKILLLPVFFIFIEFYCPYICLQFSLYQLNKKTTEKIFKINITFFLCVLKSKSHLFTIYFLQYDYFICFFFITKLKVFSMVPFFWFEMFVSFDCRGKCKNH